MSQDQGASPSGTGCSSLRDQAPAGLDPSASPPCAAHTPGPWHVEPSAFHSAFHEVVSFHPALIAQIRENNADDGLGDIGLANARLISAAPDLLEALEIARKRLAADAIFIAKIDAAIAKARGEVA
jgi:hypothetical protein